MQGGEFVRKVPLPVNASESEWEPVSNRRRPKAAWDRFFDQGLTRCAVLSPFERPSRGTPHPKGSLPVQPHVTGVCDRPAAESGAIR